MPKMVANHHFTRVDTLELKNQIYRKIGRQKADNYFDQLKRFFSLKLSKAEFDKSCIRTIGRDNLWLHNKLIRSIAQNACQAKLPPQKGRKIEGLGVRVPNGYQRNCIQSLHSPQSPRKCRSPHKFRDRPSPLGPLGKSPSTTCEETVTRTQEQQSATELQSLHKFVEFVSVEDGEEVEQFSGSDRVNIWSGVTAPIGVNIDDARKARHCGYRYISTNNNAFSGTCQSSLDLPDTVTLRNRLETKLGSEGVGVSMDCANVLNNCLDLYLKRLLGPCIGIAGSGKQSNDQMSVERQHRSKDVSILDFRVAMESNPRVLGEDWPIQLEKVCHYASGLS